MARPIPGCSRRPWRRRRGRPGRPSSNTTRSRPWRMTARASPWPPPAGEFRAPVLLNTAGFWGAAVAARFGEAVPCTPLSPNMVVTEPLPYFLKPSLGVVGGDIYLRQIARGNVIFGGGHGECDPAIPASRPRPEVTLAAMQRAAAVIPRLAGAMVIRSWSRHRRADGGWPAGHRRLRHHPGPVPCLRLFRPWLPARSRHRRGAGGAGGGWPVAGGRERFRHPSFRRANCGRS